MPCAGRTYGHNGGMAGFESNALAAADGSRVAVILLNGRTDGGSGDSVAVEAVRRLYCAAR